jgi:hypothetical protein
VNGKVSEITNAKNVILWVTIKAVVLLSIGKRKGFIFLLFEKVGSACGVDGWIRY